MKYTPHRRCKLPVPRLNKRNRLKIRPAGQSVIMENILGLITPKTSIKEHDVQSFGVLDTKNVFLFTFIFFFCPISKYTNYLAKKHILFFTYIHYQFNTNVWLNMSYAGAHIQRRNDAVKKNCTLWWHGHSLAIHR